MKRTLLFAALAAASATAVAQDKPAPAPTRPVTDTYHGETVSDPYRWLEDYKSAEARAWAASQDAYARKQLEALPARAHYAKRLAELDAIPVDIVSSRGAMAPAVLKDGTIFFARRGPGQSQARLWMRDAKGAAREIFDPSAGRAADAPPRALSWFFPSPTGKHVAYAVAEGGSEKGELFVMALATQKVVDGPIPRADFALPSWLPDGSGFFYTQLAVSKDETDRYANMQVRFHALGAKGEDPVVFGNAHPASKDIGKEHLPFVVVDPAGELLYGLVSPGTERPYALYVADVKEWRAGKVRWTKLFGADAGYEVQQPDEVPPLAMVKGRLPVFTRKGNPNGSVVTLDPRKPGEAPKPLYAAKDLAITYYGQAKGAFFVREQDGAVGAVKRIDVASGKVSAVRLPFKGSASFAQPTPEAGALLLQVGGWTRPLEWVRVPEGKSESVPLPLVDNAPLKPLEILASEEVLVPGHDGVKVPMSVIYRKGMAKDGTARAIVSAYGGYGLVDEPYFSRNVVALAERGFVYAVCHVRGSGAYGERWHKAGYKATKPNTWKDMVSCAEYLARNKYASPKRIGGTGGSAGGITIGRAVTERPDVFSAAVIRVGALDQLRFETTANGRQNISEFGTVAIPEEYKGLKAMSTYHAITDGTKYPALLLTHGYNDPRVPVWMTTKTTARFQAASASGKPVLARIDMEAGHGIGSSTRQRIAESADIYAFFEEYLK